MNFYPVAYDENDRDIVIDLAQVIQNSKSLQTRVDTDVKYKYLVIAAE